MAAWEVKHSSIKMCVFTVYCFALSNPYADPMVAKTNLIHMRIALCKSKEVQPPHPERFRVQSQITWFHLKSL
jgi:hypothetical protein